MPRILLALLIMAGSVPTAIAPALAQGAAPAAPIVVSCYRGPWEDVIWDHPRAPFVNSLIAAGYDRAAARRIGEQVCRDPSLVNDPDAMRAAMQAILRDR